MAFKYLLRKNTRQRSFLQTMHGKLVTAFLILTLVPLGIVGILAYLQAQQTLQSHIHEELDFTSLIQAQVVEQWLSERQDDMVVLAGTARVRTMDPLKAGEAVKQYFDQWGVYETMMLIKRDGLTAFSTDGVDYDLRNQIYCQKAMHGEIFISNPTSSKTTGQVVFVIAAPVIVDNEIIGVVAGELNTDHFSQIFQWAQSGETGEAYLINPGGYFITPSRFTDELIKAGQVKERAELELMVASTGARNALAGKDGLEEYVGYRGNPVIGAYRPISGVGWGLLVEQEVADAYQPVTRLRTMMIIIMLGTIILTLSLAFLISRRISKPVSNMARVALSLAAGDIRQEISYRSRDELGDLAESFRATIAYQKAITEAAIHIADGDLTVSVAPQSDQDDMGKAFERMIEALRQIVSQLAVSADNLGMASHQLAAAANQAGIATSQIAATVQQVAIGTAQQAESVTKTASTVERMSRAINGVAHGAQEQARAVSQGMSVAAQITTAVQQVILNASAVTKDSSSAAGAARSGASTVEETIRGMETIQAKVGLSAQKVQEMGQRSAQVGMIVETIEDIASQTNLLALNAAIEAARAGEHGKGFAVVAEEVRKLSERAAGATKEISGLIRGIQKTVAEAVKAMNEGSAEVEQGVKRANMAGYVLEDISKAAESVYRQAEQAAQSAQHMHTASSELISTMDMVASVVEENTASTGEMSANSSDLSQFIETVASVSEENSAAIEEVSASAEEMSAQVLEMSASAQSLAELADTLRVMVAQFKLKAAIETPRKASLHLPENAPVLTAAIGGNGRH